MQVRGARANAQAFDCDYELQFVRGYPSAITVTEESSGNLLAQIDLMPAGGGFRVAFADGQEFRVGWPGWWRLREFVWTDEDRVVVTSIKTRAGKLLRVNTQVGRKTWILIALLQLGLYELRRPWF